MTSLKELDLEGGKYLAGADLSPFSHLTLLCIDSSTADADTLRHIGALTRLRSLDISCMGLEHPSYKPEDIVQLSRLTSLTNLHLIRTALDAGSMRVLSLLTNLEVLDIEDTGLCGADMAAVSTLTKLHHLCCGYSKLALTGAMHIAKCQHLRTLDVMDNDLGPEGARTLTVLTGLENLIINNNGIGAMGACYIANNLTALTNLHIASNELGPTGAAHIACMTQLKRLDISDNCLNAEALQFLVTSLHRLSDDLPWWGRTSLAGQLSWLQKPH